MRRACRGFSSVIGRDAKVTTKLKRLLNSDKLEYLMEAHSGISAKIVKNTGFAGIWASGLGISAQMGVRDNNEASWTQVLEVSEHMADAAPGVPILLDADTGYGNFNNARRLLRKLEDRGVAGMCIEDKLFPKTNSLMDNRVQPLAKAEEFALKIQACKEYQRDPDFCLVARVESFIAGHGLDETLMRAELYSQAGADAVLIHSKLQDASQIQSFMNRWHKNTPVVIVPTTYHTTPTSLFSDWGIALVIWANHNIRASIRAMQSTSEEIFNNQSVTAVQHKVAKVQEIFELQNDDELKDAERKYLP